ncbi:Uncharacterized protein APZ42_003557 [Daphnia magna]|uniref:Uncharacterized protein n=1 Tax=Daphnia magna TaxID=35525 RepID=A0A162C2E6_9CRUS|nr:Uncharacterized protein APZ42_003557 [Daphnia magna]
MIHIVTSADSSYLYSVLVGFTGRPILYQPDVLSSNCLHQTLRLAIPSLGGYHTQSLEVPLLKGVTYNSYIEVFPFGSCK